LPYDDSQLGYVVCRLGNASLDSRRNVTQRARCACLLLRVSRLLYIGKIGAKYVSPRDMNDLASGVCANSLLLSALSLLSNSFVRFLN